MKHQELDVPRDGGNVYRDLGQDKVDVKQFKALHAAEIIKTFTGEVRRGDVGAGLRPTHR